MYNWKIKSIFSCPPCFNIASFILAYKAALFSSSIALWSDMVSRKAMYSSAPYVRDGNDFAGHGLDGSVKGQFVAPHFSTISLKYRSTSLKNSLSLINSRISSAFAHITSQVSRSPKRTSPIAQSCLNTQTSIR